MKQSKEVWKIVRGYRGRYFVSNFGRVKSRTTFLNGKTKEVFIGVQTKRGYVNVSLYKDGVINPIGVHRLVAKYFIKNDKRKPHINHINGIKNDNHFSNLEWCTQSENVQHGYDYLGVIAGKKGRYTKSQVSDMREKYKVGVTQQQIANEYGLCQQTVSDIIHKKRYFNDYHYKDSVRPQIHF